MTRQINRTLPPPTSSTSSVLHSSSGGALGRARPRWSDDLVTDLARHLTDRDRYLCDLLAEHRVLTTNQITTVAFESPISARHRLSTLYRLRVLDRFRPFRVVGTAPHHFVLDVAGAMVIAAERGVDVDDLRWRRDRALALQSSRQLEHRVGVNGFFCALLGTARRDPATELAVWWSERRCRASFGDAVHPDGYGVWRERDREVAFFLEYDRGTETHERLVGKLDGYTTLARATSDPFVVLFCFTGHRREVEARRALAVSSVPIATATADVSPEDRTWLLVGPETSRRSLGEFAAAAPGQGGR